MRFAEMTAPEIVGLSRVETLIVAPIAACEQHSRHLPVFTDSILVGAVAAEGLERQLARSDRAASRALARRERTSPPLRRYPHGHASNLRTDAHRSAHPLLRDGFRRVMLLNGHGGNIPTRCTRPCGGSRPDVSPRTILTGAAYWELAEQELAAFCEGPRKTMGHACEIETSMLMHLRPDLVRPDLIKDDPDETPAAA